MMNRILFQGHQQFGANFSVLVAGGGTGNSICFLTEQLRNSEARLTYLDLSKASMEIAKTRVQLRGLGMDRVKWVQNKIENIPHLNLGMFDYIESTGVLHHLPQPDVGLQVLSQIVKESGGMNVMVYGTIGRTGIYQMQDLARLINDDISDRKEEASNILKLLESMADSTSEESAVRRIIPRHGEHSDTGTKTCNPQLQRINDYNSR